jgi:HD-like signal output (HDOD) protein
MLERRKLNHPPANVVYQIDGAAYGLDDGLAAAIKNSICRRLESKTLEIPRLPQVAGRILELARNPSTDLDDIVKALTTDAVLVARILTVANSAAFGTGQPISGLQPAVMRLGTKTVEDMVFAESIRLKIFSVRSYRPLLQQSWQLSLATAIACEALSKATGVEREGAFLLGLLHDTGKPVLVLAISEYERQNNGQSLGQDMVEILLSQLHEEIGAYVLESWGMPESIVGAAGAHHAYRGPGHATPAQQLVHAGNLICQHLGIGDVQRDINFSIEHAFADLNLADTDRIEPILDTVTRELESLMVGLE